MDDLDRRPDARDPASPDPSPTRRLRRRRRGLRVALGGLAALVIVGVPAGLALYAASRRAPATSSTGWSRPTPTSTRPSTSTRRSPRSSTSRGCSGTSPRSESAGDLQSHIDQGMDTALKPEGLSFEKDVRPWLGTQVALAMRLERRHPDRGAHRLEGRLAAAATLARIRTTDGGRRDSWTRPAHNGVTVSVGTPGGGGEPLSPTPISTTPRWSATPRR